MILKTPYMLCKLYYHPPIYIYILVVEGDPVLPVQYLLHWGVEKDATPFLGLLHFTLDPYLVMLSVKQGGIKYHFWVFRMTRPGIKPRSPGSLAKILLMRPMTRQSVCQWSGRAEFNPRSSHTKDSKNGTWCRLA